MDTSRLSNSVTLAICTHNRLAFLKRCLEEVVKLNKSGIPVLVIDNNSRDGTSDYCMDLADRVTFLSYYLENKIGLSNARNLALLKCESKYLAFIDDDAYPSKNYFLKLKEFCQTEFDVLGGVEEVYSDVDIPQWYSNLKANVGGKSFGSGFNIVFNAKTLKNVGAFDDRIGMTGKKVAYGEEVLPQVHIKRNKGKLILSDHLIVNHFVHKYKLTKKWHFQSSFASGRDSWILFDKPKLSIKDLIYILLYGLRDLRSVGIGFRSSLRICFFWGKMFGAVRHMK